MRSLYLLLAVLYCASANVLEFDDKFPAAAASGKWFVMFYAPWCGHCKHMAGAWKEVGSRLKDTDVHVGRLDCTKYSSTSKMYGVRGFPTIKFFRDGETYEYNGAREANQMLAFISKASGPVVEKVNGEDDLMDTIEKNEVVFTFVGTEASSLWPQYEGVAKQLFTELKFTSIHPNLLETYNIEAGEGNGRVVVFKDGTFYPMKEMITEAEMIKLWVFVERLPSYPQLDGYAYSKLKKTGRLLAISVFENEGDQVNASVGAVALKRNKPFTFCWSQGGEKNLVNSLTYSVIPRPNLVVFDPKQASYYVMSDHRETFDEADIEEFLDDVKAGKIPALGGSSLWQQFKRMISDLTFSFIGFFQDSPVLASVVIVVPTLLVTFICVCVCTMGDDMEDGEYDDDDEYDSEDDQVPPPYDQERPEIAGPDAEGVRKRVVTQDVEE